MTAEEAIRILDPETSREALQQYEEYEDRLEVVDEACRVACSALRDQKTQLDRSRWDGCPNCGKWQVYGYRNYKPAYCRDCGKPLNEQAWSELERRINGNNGT